MGALRAGSHHAEATQEAMVRITEAPASWRDCKALARVDRPGSASFKHIIDNKQLTIEAALVQRIAPDALVLFDRAPQYEAIAKAHGISYEILSQGRRSAKMPKAYHLNSVNSLHAAWKVDFRKKWRGPATKYLDGYARWMVARRKGDVLTTFRAILA